MSRFAVLLLIVVLASKAAWAQPGPPGPPPIIGVVKAKREPITQSNEFVGRIEATNRVDLVARVTAFLDKRLFTEGSEVTKGDLLYQLERGPFEADVQAKAAAVQQAEAQLRNATLTMQRAEALLHTPAGQQSTVDNARAAQQTQQAMLLQAQANLRLADINLGYTSIHAPISGRIGRSAVTEGNVVSPQTGTLATIVSQDPMYVSFPIAYRAALDLRTRYADKGGFDAVLIKLKLPDGRLYDQAGKLSFVNNSLSTSTDTILLRGTIPNPPLGAHVGNVALRELTDNEFVTVVLQGVNPIEALTIPRAAVLADQSGDYVYSVDAQNKVQQQRITLGQSSPSTAVVVAGLTEGQMVVVEGVQKVRPGLTVQPAPATPSPAVPAGVGAPAAAGAATAPAAASAPAPTAAAAPARRE